MLRKFIRREELDVIARQFLREHHPTLDLPVPIEQIVEHQLHLNIIPFPRLERDFGVDAFLAHSMEAIFVDEFQMMRQEARYRLTLAHEAAHLLLHKDLYVDANVTDLESYLRFSETMEPRVREGYEVQAFGLGARILLPRESLVALAMEALAPIRNALPKAATANDVCKRLAVTLAPACNVTAKVIEKRLLQDHLYKDLELEVGICSTF